MRFDIITAVPELLDSPLGFSIVKRAKERLLVQIHTHNLRDYSTNRYRQIDDCMYGGGAGMVLMIEPVDRCIAELKTQRHYDEIIYLAPDGEQFTQSIANNYSLKQNFILLCGHYKGIDERIREHLITKEISLGDFVLSGGELAAAVLIDAIVRLIPNALNDSTSALEDSFQNNLISPPAYTRPTDYKGLKVPQILLSGNHKLIADWRHEQALQRTQQRRPSLLDL